MLRRLLCVLLYAVAGSQLLPLSPTPLPTGFTPSIPPLYSPTLPPTPTPFPFAPIPGVPGIPGVPAIPVVPPVPGARNPYYYNGVGPAVPILTYSNEGPNIDGSYTFSYSTADGKQVQESGFLKDAYIDNNGEPQGTQVVQGSYAYISPEGTPVQVSYVADENGFRPSGVHIPANGRGVYNENFTRGALDPAFNRYTNPYNANPYNTNPYNAKPYNAYPYNANPYNANPYNANYRNPYNPGYNNQYNNPLARQYNHPLANHHNHPLGYDPKYNSNDYQNLYPRRQGLYDAPYDNAGYKYDKETKDISKKD